MERSIICLAVSIMIFVFSPAHGFTLFPEVNTDRPGCDFKNFVVPGANASNAKPVSARMHVVLILTVRLGALMPGRAQVRAS
jgi:hypothetical protein